MAITAAGQRLTEGHARTQSQIRAATLRQIVAIWPTLDAARLDATSPGFIASATNLIVGGRALSARASALYLEQFRLAEGVLGRAPITLDRPTGAVREAIRTSLTVTGPVSIKRAAAQGRFGPAVLGSALSMVAASASRHVADGGRVTIRESVAQDRKALGWARAASANACSFCALLASRGPVYGEASGDFDAHDGCGCGIEPVYGDNYEWPANSQDYADAYAAAREPTYQADYYSQFDGQTMPGPKSTKTGADRRTSEFVNGPFRAYLKGNR